MWNEIIAYYGDTRVTLMILVAAGFLIACAVLGYLDGWFCPECGKKMDWNYHGYERKFGHCWDCGHCDYCNKEETVHYEGH